MKLVSLRKKRIVVFLLVLCFVLAPISSHAVTSKDEELAAAEAALHQATLEAQKGLLGKAGDARAKGTEIRELEDKVYILNGQAKYSDSDKINKKIEQTKEYYSFSINTNSQKFFKISLGSIINGVSNIIFGLAKAWIGISARLTAWVINFGIYSYISSSVTNTLKSITGSLGNVFVQSNTGLSGLVWFGIAFSFASVVILFLKKQTSGAFGKLLATIFVVTLIGSYMVIPNFCMEKAQQITSQIGVSLLGTGGASAGDTAGEKIWLMGVDTPWQSLEFGETIVKIDSGGALKTGGDVNEWLVTYPDDRSERYGDGSADEDSLPDGSGSNIPDGLKGVSKRWADKPSAQAFRVGEAFVILILDLFLGVLFVILSAITLGFQVGSLIMWFVGFFVLIASLFPTHGLNKIKEWGGVLALTYFGQIVTYAVMMVVIYIVSALFGKLDGLIETFGAAAGLGAGLWLMKGPVMRLFSGNGSLSEASGGIVDMAKGARLGFRGDSTQRMMPNPIAQNREAKRMAQRETKMRAYQGKMEQRQARKDASLTRAAGGMVKAGIQGYKADVIGPVKDTKKDIQGKKQELASKISKEAEYVKMGSAGSIQKAADKEAAKEEKMAEARKLAAQKYEEAKLQNPKVRDAERKRQMYEREDAIRQKYPTKEARQEAKAQKMEAVKQSQPPVRQNQKMESVKQNKASPQGAKMETPKPREVTRDKTNNSPMSRRKK